MLVNVFSNEYWGQKENTCTTIIPMLFCLEHYNLPLYMLSA